MYDWNYDYRGVRLESTCQYFGENIAHIVWQHDGVLIAYARMVIILGNEDYLPIAQVGWHFASL
jgi:hypothetical protein